jgi:hypothetical protein
MITLHKKLIVDERGNPTDVVIPWPEFVELAELLGLDLDANAVADLEAAHADRQAGNQDAFVDLDTI